MDVDTRPTVLPPWRERMPAYARLRPGAPPPSGTVVVMDVEQVVLQWQDTGARIDDIAAFLRDPTHWVREEDPTARCGRWHHQLDAQVRLTAAHEAWPSPEKVPFCKLFRYDPGDWAYGHVDYPGPRQQTMSRVVLPPASLLPYEGGVLRLFARGEDNDDRVTHEIVQHPTAWRCIVFPGTSHVHDVTPVSGTSPRYVFYGVVGVLPPKPQWTPLSLPPASASDLDATTAESVRLAHEATIAAIAAKEARDGATAAREVAIAARAREAGAVADARYVRMRRDACCVVQ